MIGVGADVTVGIVLVCGALWWWAFPRPVVRYLVLVDGRYLRRKSKTLPNGWTVLSAEPCEKNQALLHTSERAARKFVRDHRGTSSLDDLALDWTVERVVVD